MKKFGWNAKHTIQLLLIAACVLLLVLMVAVEVKVEFKNDYLTNVRFESQNGQIKVLWDLPVFNNARRIIVSVSNSRGEYMKTLPPGRRSLTITDGFHGEKFKISVQEQYKNYSTGEKFSKELLFLDYDQIPDFPTVYLETASHDDPPWTLANKPDDTLWGVSVENNDYVEGDMVFKWPGHETVSSETYIKVRGNTSSTGGMKKSYRLKLHQAVDMLDMGRKHADKEWLLLDVGQRLNNHVGQFLAEECGMEWVAHGMLVNVMLNDDWKGLYYLSETVDRGKTRGDVSKDGYILEDTAYWWKTGTIYFKTENEIPQLGFTFKYPDITDPDDERIAEAKSYMDTVSALIISGDSSVPDYIDYDTFASWVMVRDIIHCGDGGGSNMFYYLNELDTDDYTENKLKMGPLWDFDASMKESEQWFPDITGWSSQHISKYNYFAYLFNDPRFKDVYLKKWQDVSSGLQNKFDSDLEELYAADGAAIEASRVLDSSRWDTGLFTLRDEIDYDKEFIRQRIEWINSAVKDW